MLIDFISIEKLPSLIVWLDWNFYAYRFALFCFILAFILHYLITAHNYNIAGLLIAIFCGFCAWCVYCVVRYGYLVG